MVKVKVSGQPPRRGEGFPRAAPTRDHLTAAGVTARLSAAEEAQHTP